MAPGETSPTRNAANDPHLTRVTARLRAAGCVRAEDEARLLVADATSRPDPSDRLDLLPGQPDRLESLVRRRETGEPLEHVLGWAEIGGLRVSVAPGVFVPRHRSVLLATEATASAQAAMARPGEHSGAISGRKLTGSPHPEARPAVLDLCCGTGILGALVATALGGGNQPGDGGDRPGADGEQVRSIELVAADLDPAAVACARENLRPYGASVHHGDLFDPLPPTLRGRVDVLIANVPYVPTGRIATLPPEARDHEARLALDGGADGLDVLRLVAAQAPAWLAPGGHLLTEAGATLADAAARVLADAGMEPRAVHDDDTVVVIGVKPPG